MRYLSLLEILELHDNIIEVSGGAKGIRDMRALESAINQPSLTFNQIDLYPDILTKAADIFELVIEMPRNIYIVLYILVLIAVVVSVDLLFFRNRF